MGLNGSGDTKILDHFRTTPCQMHSNDDSDMPCRLVSDHFLIFSQSKVCGGSISTSTDGWESLSSFLVPNFVGNIEGTSG